MSYYLLGNVINDGSLTFDVQFGDQPLDLYTVGTGDVDHSTGEYLTAYRILPPTQETTSLFSVVVTSGDNTYSAPVYLSWATKDGVQTLQYSLSNDPFAWAWNDHEFDGSADIIRIHVSAEIQNAGKASENIGITIGAVETMTEHDEMA